MADIELVIKIPDEVYKEIASHTNEAHSFVYLDLDQLGRLDNAIRNGTPLPKGHGRMIDKDEVLPKIHGVKSIHAVVTAPTILEADVPKLRKSTPLEENDSGYNCKDWIP